MAAIWFDEAEDAHDLMEALEAEGYTTALAREGFAGEDDSEDRAWVLTVTPFDGHVTALVDAHGGWLPSDDRVRPAPAPLPQGPRRARRDGDAEARDLR